MPGALVCSQKARTENREVSGKLTDKASSQNGAPERKEGEATYELSRLNLERSSPPGLHRARDPPHEVPLDEGDVVGGGEGEGGGEGREGERHDQHARDDEEKGGEVHRS